MKNCVLGSAQMGAVSDIFETVVDVANHLNRYLTEKRPPSFVSRRFRALDEKDKIFEDGFGETVNGKWKEGWIDMLGGCIYDLSDLYKKTKGVEGARFIVFYDNGYTSMILAQGNPGAPTIKQAVSDSNAFGMDVGMPNKKKWPAECEEGASITMLCLHGGDATITFQNGNKLEITDIH